MKLGALTLTWAEILLGPLLMMAGTAALAERSDAFWRALGEVRHGTVSRVDSIAHGAVDPDIIVFGSSMALRNLDEEQLSSRLGGATALNLGLYGATAIASAMWAPEVARIKPGVAVLVLGPLELDAGADDSWRGRYHPRAAADIYGPLDWLKRPARHLEGLLDWAHPLYRNLEGLRYRLEEGPAPKPHPRVAMRMPAEHLAPRLRESAKLLDAMVLTQDSHNADGLLSVQRTLADAGVPLLIVPSPIHPRLEADSYPPAMFALLDQLAAELPLDVLSAEDMGTYGAELFADPLHLNTEGQSVFTWRVAEQLKLRMSR